MSDTPRTDAASHNMGSVAEPHYVVDIDLARDLERELAELREELNDKSKFCYAVEQALDGLKGDYVEIIVALRKDAERYRYVRSIWGLPDDRFNAAVDAAMKECGK